MVYLDVDGHVGHERNKEGGKPQRRLGPSMAHVRAGGQQPPIAGTTTVHTPFFRGPRRVHLIAVTRPDTTLTLSESL